MAGVKPVELRGDSCEIRKRGVEIIEHDVEMAVASLRFGKHAAVLETFERRLSRSGGEGAKGFKTLNWHANGANFPALADVIKHVVDKGKSQVASRDKVGQGLYNHGVYNSILIAEAIRNAQKLSGRKVISGEDMRRGLESLDVDAARLKEMGFEGFTAPIKLSCTDHNGHGATYVQAWDGTAYVKASEMIGPLSDKVQPLLDAAAREYVEKNTGWPTRTEACDKP